MNESLTSLSMAPSSIAPKSKHMGGVAGRMYGASSQVDSEKKTNVHRHAKSRKPCAGARQLTSAGERRKR